MLTRTEEEHTQTNTHIHTHMHTNIHLNPPFPLSLCTLRVCPNSNTAAPCRGIESPRVHQGARASRCRHARRCKRRGHRAARRESSAVSYLARVCKTKQNKITQPQSSLGILNLWQTALCSCSHVHTCVGACVCACVPVRFGVVTSRLWSICWSSSRICCFDARTMAPPSGVCVCVCVCVRVRVFARVVLCCVVLCVACVKGRQLCGHGCEGRACGVSE